MKFIVASSKPERDRLVARDDVGRTNAGAQSSFQVTANDVDPDSQFGVSVVSVESLESLESVPLSVLSSTAFQSISYLVDETTGVELPVVDGTVVGPFESVG